MYLLAEIILASFSFLLFPFCIHKMSSAAAREIARRRFETIKAHVNVCKPPNNLLYGMEITSLILKDILIATACDVVIALLGLVQDCTLLLVVCGRCRRHSQALIAQARRALLRFHLHRLFDAFLRFANRFALLPAHFGEHFEAFIVAGDGRVDGSLLHLHRVVRAANFDATLLSTILILAARLDRLLLILFRLKSVAFLLQLERLFVREIHWQRIIGDFLRLFQLLRIVEWLTFVACRETFVHMTEQLRVGQLQNVLVKQIGRFTVVLAERRDLTAINQRSVARSIDDLIISTLLIVCEAQVAL